MAHLITMCKWSWRTSSGNENRECIKEVIAQSDNGEINLALHSCTTRNISRRLASCKFFPECSSCEVFLNLSNDLLMQLQIRRWDLFIVFESWLDQCHKRLLSSFMLEVRKTFSSLSQICNDNEFTISNQTQRVHLNNEQSRKIRGEHSWDVPRIIFLVGGSSFIHSLVEMLLNLHFLSPCFFSSRNRLKYFPLRFLLVFRRKNNLCPSTHDEANATLEMGSSLLEPSLAEIRFPDMFIVRPSNPLTVCNRFE